MIYLKLLATAIFWGGTFIAGRMLAGHVMPFAAAFLRFCCASACLWVLVRRQQGHLPALPRSQIIPVLLLGLTGVFAYNALFFKGLEMIGASRASLIIANNPVCIAILAALLFREKLGFVKIAGIVLSVAGAMVTVSRGDLSAILAGGAIGWGDVLIFGCVLSWAGFSIVGKTVLVHLAPLVAIFYAALVGTAALLVPALMEGLPAAWPTYRLVDWMAIAYLGIFGTAIGFVWYYEGIERIGPVRSGLFINFVPLSAIVMAYLLLGESVTGSLVVGAAMIIAGVYLTNTGGMFIRSLVQRTFAAKPTGSS